MAPVPAEYQPDFWNKISSEFTENHPIELTCLMPNGIIILLKANYDTSLEEIKEDVFEEAARMPLSGKLKNRSEYMFKIINSMAEKEELFDGNRRLCDIRPVGAVLIVTECRRDTDHSINSAIGHLIGKALQDFDALNSSEINEFRYKMRKLGDEIAQNRAKDGWLEKLYYQFPPRIADGSYIMMMALKENKQIPITVICEDSKGPSLIKEPYSSYTNPRNASIQDIAGDAEVMQSSKFMVEPTKSTVQLIEMVIQKRVTLLNKKNEKISDYVLKVCGRDEYLVGDYQIIQFEYIQECFSKDIPPKLLIVHVSRVPVVNPENVYGSVEYDRTNRTPSYSSNNTLRRKKTATSWSVQKNFSLSVCTVTKVNTKKTSETSAPVENGQQVEIGIQVGLFHGGKPLCQPLRTDERPVTEVNNQLQVSFDESNLLEFDIQVCNIPRNAKACFVVYELNKANHKGTKSRKPKDNIKENQMNPIAWANTSVFDFNGQLKKGAMTLYMWTYAAEDMLSDEVLHPLGTVVSNPNTDYSTALTLKFSSFLDDHTPLFPSVQNILEYATQLEHDPQNYDDVNVYSETEFCRKLLIERQENFDDLHDQDRKNIWSHKRYWMQNMPEVLPKLISCIDWDKREEVCQVIALLREWPKLPVEKSLELLDYAFADQEVRSFAVNCLENVSDEDLQLYLLQLVQAIKHELYLECELVKFLIQRALNNQKIGHFLFWHLRSEMQVPSVSVRFGLILEAYCRGSQEHMPILQKQLQCIEKLKKCSEKVRDTKDKERAKQIMKDFLHNSLETQSVRSPLDPSLKCRQIKVDDSRVMDSKMRPLRLAFENSDIHGDDIFIIFKNGDDLRQDMLTLQMLKIMDRLWKREGLDLRINAYNCISLEYRVGLIEVVLAADTLANIQKDKGVFTATAAFSKGNILAWLKDHNTTESSLNKAIHEFTLSCAGYCVATYVLGIADRHSDNIMVKTNGQLFHIDFGHILGHFKQKYGIKRERVPFVLTHDFVYVINKGQTLGQNRNPLEFKIFREYCEKAFMILRKHGGLILSLFGMMISTGLPELSSEKDLQYLRDTLVLSKTDEEALSHFRAKFDEALSNSWKTLLNWTSHNISKNNKA